MNRRDFFSAFSAKSEGKSHQEAIASAPLPAVDFFDMKPLNVEAGLEPYIPDEHNPWDKHTVGHLLRRCLFEPTKEQVEEFATLSPAVAIDRLLRMPPLPSPLPWHDETYRRPISPEEQLEFLRVNNERARELQGLFFTTATSGAPSLREKMVYFWHNHFTTSQQVVRLTQLTHTQIFLFYSHAIGNFRELTQKITIDPAMLLYLDGHLNRVGRPNENYARELFELFTLGEGNYTEQDIVEASRALTGWTINIQTLESVFSPILHDRTVKEIFGQRGNFGAEDVVNLACDRIECSLFLAEKLYRYFVYSVPDRRIVEQLARILRENDLEIAPALRVLLSSAHFYDRAFHGAQIKNPLQQTMGLSKHFELRVPQVYFQRVSGFLGLEFLYPPDVAGWQEGRAWINTTTLPMRFALARGIVYGLGLNGQRLPGSLDPVAFARSFASIDVADDFVREVCTYLLSPLVKESTIKRLKETLLAGTPEYEWGELVHLSRNAPQLLAAKITPFLDAVVQLPEYQLF